MPSDYLKGTWSLATSDDGAWTLETRQDDCRLPCVIAMRAPWPSRAAESLAHGRLCLAAPKMYEALQTYMQNRAWAIEAGAENGALAEDVIQRFAEMQRNLHEQVVAALAEAEGAT